MKQIIKKLFNHFGVEIFLKRENYHYIPDVYGKSQKKLIDIRNDEVFYNKANKAMQDGRTYLYYDRLFHLYQAAINVIKNCPPTEEINALEVGVFKGGSSFFIASLLQRLAPERSKKMFAVDTFEGHREEDLPLGTEGVHIPSLFSDTSYQDVRDYLGEFPFVSVIKNRIQVCSEDLRKYQFGLIHLDVDIYEPMYFSLNTFAKEMPVYGICVVDDYNYRTSPGVKKAVTRFSEENPGGFTFFQLETGQCLITKCNKY